ncbi:PAS domain-containing hybrid sensor histidine kinase/response regulator [Paracoccus tibetensis]|uniref:histidine kinase n=1 Tax=Paracoccus tibetensis TaxID=336292 RepID=A0A1G5HVK9_9RHOB|nr:PAS domain-containing hybrid sensor histidine kinase/response regulator [Paracoccus tibetensis]SCY67885.1 PAS domain S-box-containing protein [Paracoccus tibetensis]
MSTTQGPADSRTSPEMEDLEDLFDTAPCGYVSAGADGRIIRANRTLAGWLGHDVAVFSGKRLQDFLNIAGKIYFETHFAPLLRMQGFFHEVALDLVRADGSTLPVLVNAEERRDAAGQLRFVRVTVFNATDRRRYERELLQARTALEELNRTLEARVVEAVEARLATEDALRQAQKMEAVGQLTGGIAHDFKNMLAVISAALNLTERRLRTGGDVAPFILAARDGVERATALIQRLLAFSRRQALVPVPVDPNRMIAEMVDFLRRTLGNGVQLRTELAPGTGQLLADSSMLENALLNLAINARDAMPGGGELVIATANRLLGVEEAAGQRVAPGPCVTIAVTDTGIGMTPEIAAKAFEPFFTTKGVGQGTGLGLSQVFAFARQSGGHVAIRSAPGEGTTITLCLPQLPAEAAGPAHDASGAEILIVDDDPQSLSLKVEMLSGLGYAVHLARSAVEVQDRLASGPGIALVLTCADMRGHGGRTLAQDLARCRPDLKLLVTSPAAGAGCPDHLPWPAPLDQLAARLQALLDPAR